MTVEIVLRGDDGQIVDSQKVLSVELSPVDDKPQEFHISAIVRIGID